MGERVRPHAALRLLLQGVVADVAGRVQGFLDVARLQPLQALLAVVRPHPRVAIRLQFLPHRQAIGAIHRGAAATRLVDLVEHAGQFLHVMADLVRDHVGAGEVAGGMQFVLQLLEERQVQVHLLVARAIERAHRRGGAAAGRVHATAEQVQLGLDIGGAVRLEDRTPALLGRMQDRADEGLLLGIDLERLPGLRRCARRGAALVQQCQRILEEDPAQQRQHDQAAQAHAATAAETRATAATAVDLDVAAAAAFSPIHRNPLLTDARAPTPHGDDSASTGITPRRALPLK